MAQKKIILKKVKVHNLKSIDLSLDLNQLIVFTGVSGSGKSSLAFDTIYTEGQRRYIESLSTYARRHLGDFPKPEAESIEGISPTIAIEQKTTGKNPRSTVGTLTSIYDFLRVLYARIGTPHCPISKEPISPQSSLQILDSILSLPQGTKVILLSPYITGKKGEFKEEFAELIKKGYTRIRLDGKIIDLQEEVALEGTASHDIDIVIDRLQIDFENKPRFTESVQLALDLGQGLMKVLKVDTQEELFFSQHASSKKSGLSYGPLEPSDFSFNHPTGMCPNCQGLGVTQQYNLEAIIDPKLSISQDCCFVASPYETVRYGNIYRNLAKIYKFSVDTPWKDLSKAAKQVFLFGTESKWTEMRFVHPEKKTSWTEYVQWKGVLHEAKMRYQAAKSELYRKKMEAYLQESICQDCQGSRIKPYPAATLLNGKRISDITAMTIDETLAFFQSLPLSANEACIAEELVKEVRDRLSFLTKVGLGYLSLDRTAPTLSGGEGQRVRLASQIGSGLVGSTYILDEPSIGLHPRDHHKLLETLVQLKEKGNTVIVVEHDEDTIALADTVVDIGPLAGKDGGLILAQGSLQDILEAPESLTGGYLSGRLSIPIPKKRRKPSSQKIRIEKASHHNLKDVSITLPLGLFVAITGVSGSGKSSLIIDTFYPALSNLLQRTSLSTGKHEKLSGEAYVDKIIAIDQTPIGRTPRSNPATYVKLFDEIRDLFSLLPESKALGFDAGRFSFNVKEGSCPFCSGMGMVKIDMDFMEDEWVTCSQCMGKRFDEKTLSVRFKGKSIHDILEMTIADAHDFFSSLPKIKSKIDTLLEVGLGYMKLGQPSPTLSGGEAQRIKLAKELSRPSTGKTVYILDEPTTGLHFYDIHKLMHVLHSLVDKGNSVFVIEHNMDLVKTADWVIDLGPGAGKNGGKIIGEGSPETISKIDSPTGEALKRALGKKVFSSKPRSSFDCKPVEFLTLKGAAQNNLKQVSTKIPLGKITVCTGPSGSGKSSFAFETLYAEGQRRYIESMSHYARQFVKQMAKPKVESIEGLLASIAIEQKHHAGNPRSTIGTMTEIYDYLRILYAHLGTAYCPETGEEIRSISKGYVVDKALSLPKKTKVFILSPILLQKNESFESWKERTLKQGFLRIRLNGMYYELEEEIPFNYKQKNELFLVVDRLMIQEDSRKRLDEAIEQATTISKGYVVLATEETDISFNLAFTVERTGKSYPPITPHLFSFNTEQGMCLDCQGLGFQYGTDLSSFKEMLQLSPIDLIFSLWKENSSKTSLRILCEVLEKAGIDSDTPLCDLPLEQIRLFFHGAERKPKNPFQWKGLNTILSQYGKTSFGNIRSLLSTLLDKTPCLSCGGSRLNPLARHVKWEGITIVDFCLLPIEKAYEFIQRVSLPSKDVLEEPLRQVRKRLDFLIQTGLSYLSLDRSAPSLSGGETQRIRLSRQLGSGLTGCLYVLDEPTIGLHPHDNTRLNQALLSLKALGNTLILVEHDPMTVEIADHVIDFGPGAGSHGGFIVAEGSISSIKQNPRSLTGAYLSGRKKISLPASRRDPQKFLHIQNASLHNIHNLSVSFPIGAISCITGVSGAGKSTLMMDIILPAVQKTVGKKNVGSSPLEGADAFDKLLVLDQNPIGHTIRADVSTYVDLLTPLRFLFASLPEAKARGLQPKHFSFNHKKGMCTSCWGLGTKTVSLQFLPSVKVPCDSCEGYRLKPLSLQVSFKGKHLGQILKMSVEEARIFLDAQPKAVKILDALISVGLGYLSLGQEIATLSGGETQRMKLSRELAKRSTGRTLYLLDEPTIGLHSEDIAKLIPILHKLTDKGNTVFLIEHNLDIIANCDYIVDMGPGAGPYGGKIVASGTPEELSLSQSSVTAPYLKEYLAFLRT